MKNLKDRIENLKSICCQLDKEIFNLNTELKDNKLLTIDLDESGKNKDIISKILTIDADMIFESEYREALLSIINTIGNKYGTEVSLGEVFKLLKEEKIYTCPKCNGTGILYFNPCESSSSRSKYYPCDMCYGYGHTAKKITTKFVNGCPLYPTVNINNTKPYDEYVKDTEGLAPKTTTSNY